MDKYEEYFNQAKDKLRFTGVGGVSMPNPDLTPNSIDPIKVDPNRQLTVSKGWVMVGGQLVKKRKGQQSPIQILNMSEKIIEQRQKDAAKKNKQNNNTDSQ